MATLTLTGFDFPFLRVALRGDGQAEVLAPRPHAPALLDAVLRFLAPVPGGRYLDGTF